MLKLGEDKLSKTKGEEERGRERERERERERGRERGRKGEEEFLNINHRSGGMTI